MRWESKYRKGTLQLKIEYLGIVYQGWVERKLIFIFGSGEQLCFFRRYVDLQWSVK